MSLSELQNTYNNTLTEIGNLQQNLANRTTEYVNRVTMTNPYFNKDIQFSNNVFAHVTNKGVVKKYTIQPARVTFVVLMIPWLPAYDSQGVQIPTTPPLITGTPMNGKSIGYEGENVFVNTIIPNVESTYKGCKVSNSTVQFIGGAPASNDANGSYTYDACKQAAINSSYKFFGLQNMNADGNGFCAGSNDIANLTESRIDVPVPLKTWGPKMVGNVAGLNNRGQLIVTGTSGLINYVNNHQTPTYIGCFGINPTMTIVNESANTRSKCFKAAEQGNFNYYGLQKSFGSTIECVLGNDLTAFKKNKTSKDSCSYNQRNKYVGDTTSTAVYTRNPNETNNYFLLLNDDGSVVIYRGSEPSDFINSTKVQEWSVVPIGPNSNFTAVKSKFGTNYLMAGQTLAPGDFIGSPNGSIYLLMNISGQLVLNTTDNRINCTKLSNDTWGGGLGANAFYELTSGSGFTGDIGKLGYVDENSSMKLYDSNQVNMTNVYSQFNGLNSLTADVGAFPNIVDPSGCKIECDKNDNCAAFVFNETTKNCNLKGADFTSGISAIATDNLYVRNKQPKSSNTPGFSLVPGISDKVNAVDSTQFHNYTMNSGNYNNPLSNANSVQRAALDNATGRANLLSDQLINGTKENYDNLADNITKFNTNTSTSQNIHETITTNFRKYNENKNKIDRLRQANNDNIVKDSQTVVSQHNSQSTWLTILATGVVLISMAIVKS